ncbi:hypothetical protein C7S16_6292 [Burkholderia thailandensis]|uniref:Uncharacterized protein n=1 Tax=Burkholderia thailandensis TaxID=57975 RepID=A0AAW9CNH6_BURTH|nr:hypothetical protein [Burkholderia thailandensis]MDW9251331.1 hypothetical protein [Burkholderia thailandensis]
MAHRACPASTIDQPDRFRERAGYAAQARLALLALTRSRARPRPAFTTTRAGSLPDRRFSRQRCRPTRVARRRDSFARPRPLDPDRAS